MLPTQKSKRECFNWMSDARHKGKKHCRSLRAEHKLYELGMASKSQIIAKATGTTLTLLFFYNLCHTGTGRGLDCCVVPVLQHSHLLVNTKHIFANLQMKTCPNGKDNSDRYGNQLKS